jgi:hypothetical protein
MACMALRSMSKTVRSTVATALEIPDPVSPLSVELEGELKGELNPV